VRFLYSPRYGVDEDAIADPPVACCCRLWLTPTHQTQSAPTHQTQSAPIYRASLVLHVIAYFVVVSLHGDSTGAAVTLHQSGTGDFRPVRASRINISVQVESKPIGYKDVREKYPHMLPPAGICSWYCMTIPGIFGGGACYVLLLDRRCTPHTVSRCEAGPAISGKCGFLACKLGF